MLRSIKIAAILLITIVHTSMMNAQSWYDLAEERIEEMRKGNFGIQVLDNLGEPYTDSIKIELASHEFAWGSIVPEKNDKHSRWMRALVDYYYNLGVMGNAYKWPYVEPQQNVSNYTNTDEALAWSEKVGIGFRGHTLIWGGQKSHQMPPWTIDGSLTPQEIYEACETHITRDVGHWKGRIAEYDVVNEPTHETWFAETVGNSVNWNSFKWAKAADSAATLYVNDFNILVWDGAEAYRTLIEEMLANGAPVEGIGMQAHMEGRIDWNDVKTKLDYMAEIGLPLRVTEFDMYADRDGISDEEAASGYATMMRTVFSHPGTNGMVIWTIWDGDAYRAGSGLFDEYRLPKIANDTVYHLLHEKWTTSITDRAGDANDTLSFRGFYGDYRIRVDFNGELLEFNIPATKLNEDSVFVLEYAEGVPATANIINARIAKDADAVELTFDQAIDFSTFKPGEFSLSSNMEYPIVSFNEQDSMTVQLAVENVTYMPKQYYSIFYDGDSAVSKNTALVNRFGPLQVDNKLPAFNSGVTDTLGEIVILKFSEPMDDLISVTDFTLSVNGSDVSVSGVVLDDNDASQLVFTLANAVNHGDAIRITYTEGTYKSADGYKLISFGPKFVENRVVNPNEPDDLAEKEFLAPVKIYPNPFSNTLNFENINGLQTIYIYDMQGKLVDQTNISGLSEISIVSEDYPYGTLIIHLMDENGKLDQQLTVVKY